MTRHIIVAITPDEDGVRCRECEKIRELDCPFVPTQLFVMKKRVPECILAERKLAALIEAGEAMARRYGYDLAEAWDRAVAEVK